MQPFDKPACRQAGSGNRHCYWGTQFGELLPTRSTKKTPVLATERHAYRQAGSETTSSGLPFSKLCPREESVAPLLEPKSLDKARDFLKPMGFKASALGELPFPHRPFPGSIPRKAA